jgi:hypothetical protein
MAGNDLSEIVQKYLISSSIRSGSDLMMGWWCLARHQRSEAMTMQCMDEWRFVLHLLGMTD